MNDHKVKEKNKLIAAATDTIKYKVELTDRERYFMTLFMNQAVTVSGGVIEDERRYVETYRDFRLHEFNDKLPTDGTLLNPKTFTHTNLRDEPGTGTEIEVLMSSIDYFLKCRENKEIKLNGAYIMHLLPVSERLLLLKNGTYKAPSATGEN